MSQKICPFSPIVVDVNESLTENFELGDLGAGGCLCDRYDRVVGADVVRLFIDG